MTRELRLAHLFALVSSMTLACSGAPSPEGERPPTTMAGQLLARADLGAGRAVEFYDLQGTMVMTEVGHVDGAQAPIDFEKLRALTPVQRFQALAPDAKVPQALELAQARWLQRKDVGLPPHLRPHDRDSEGADGGELLAYGSSGGQWPSTNGTDFGNVFCWDKGQYMNWIWCPTFRNGGANSGEHYTMYFDSTCMNAASSGTATCWLDHYNPGPGWTRLATVQLGSRWYQRFWVEEVGYSRTGIAGTTVHFAERFRWAPPFVSEPSQNFPTTGDSNSHGWVNELQGVTHDASHWFMASRTQVMRFSLTADLRGYPEVLYDNPWATLWNHMGAPTYANGKVYVPLEQDGLAGGPTGRAAVGVFDTNLAFYGTAELPVPAGIPDEQRASNPWIAYNPQDGLFYSSGFDPSYLMAYDIQVNPVRVTLYRAVRILNSAGAPQPLFRIQGGAFSDNGILYLTHDADRDKPEDIGLLYTVDVLNGRVQSKSTISENKNCCKWEEIEGLTIWDSTNKGAPGITGQIHVVLLQNVGGDDNWIFKHFGAAAPF